MSRKPVKPLVLALMKPGVGYPSIGIARAIGATRDVVAQALRRLIAAQRVVSVPIGRDHLYFSSAEGAAAFSQAEAIAFAQQQAAIRKASNPRVATARAAAAARRYAVVPPRPGTAAGVTVRGAPVPEPADLTGLPVTRFAAPEVTQPWHRLILADDPRWPSLAGMGIGRYDDPGANA